MTKATADDDWESVPLTDLEVADLVEADTMTLHGQAMIRDALATLHRIAQTHGVEPFSAQICVDGNRTPTLIGSRVSSKGKT